MKRKLDDSVKARLDCLKLIPVAMVGRGNIETSSVGFATTSDEVFK